MCIYYTYHWSCCPGTARPAPYYVHSMCEPAATSAESKSKATRETPLKRCTVTHEILDGAEADQPCPRCGTKPENCDPEGSL
jgi:hypothetical protein